MASSRSRFRISGENEEGRGRKCLHNLPDSRFVTECELRLRRKISDADEAMEPKEASGVFRLFTVTRSICWRSLPQLPPLLLPPSLFDVVDYHLTSQIGHCCLFRLSLAKISRTPQMEKRSLAKITLEMDDCLTDRRVVRPPSASASSVPSTQLSFLC